MIKQTVTTTTLIGIAVLVLANVLWLGMAWETKFYESLRVVLLFFPSLAALLVAYLAPRRKILVGISMAVWGALIGTIATSIYDHLGVPVDHIGGPFSLFLILLAYQLAFCTVGSIAGYLFWRFASRERGAMPTRE